MNSIIQYFQTQSADYLGMLVSHIYISVLAALIAFAVAFPLGILVSRSPVGRALAEHLFGLIRIVPSLAILMLALPILGTGVKTALVALVALAIPPILVNTSSGINAVPVAIIEAAVGMGMSPKQVFGQVTLPLAFPYIFAGFRTAFVEVVASATLAAYIGGGGFGKIIVTGLGLLRTDYLLIGGISVAVLSLTSGTLLDVLYRSRTAYMRVKTPKRQAKTGENKN